MIVLNRREALYLFGAAAMGLAPFLFLSWPAWPPSAEYLPPVIATEVFIYLLFTMIAAPHAGWQGASLAAATAFAARGTLNAAGAAALALGSSKSFGASWMTLEYGNPLGIVMQMLFGLLYTPYLLSPYFPGILSAEAARAIEETSAIDASRERAESAALSTRLGGYIQVYTFAELTAALMQTPGLRAFSLYRTDGRTLWSNNQSALDKEHSIASSLALLKAAREWADRLRFGTVDKVALETPDHLIYILAVNPKTRLLLVFSATAPLAEIVLRIDMIRRTVFEFLRLHAEELDRQAVKTPE